MHGLIQAFSRTNRILNSVKTFGNIVYFRNLQKGGMRQSLYLEINRRGIVLIRKYFGLGDAKFVKKEEFTYLEENSSLQKVAEE